jgi:hypothetical protein
MIVSFPFQPGLVLLPVIFDDLFSLLGRRLAKTGAFSGIVGVFGS